MDSPKKIIKKTANNKDSFIGNKTEKIHGEITYDETVSDNISTLATAVDINPLMQVSFSKKRTINTGNFEFTSIEIGVTMHCESKDMNKTYGKAKDFVESRLDLEVEEVYQKNDTGDFS